MQQSLTNVADLIWIVVTNGAFLTVMYFQRDNTIPGTDVSLALATLPSLIGMNVVIGGWMGTTMLLTADREDGTLLRSKATPDGMVGYLVSRVVLAALQTVFGVGLFLGAGLLFLPGLREVPVAGWAHLVAVCALGLLATLPWGAIVGSLLKGSQSAFGLAFLPMTVMIAISGIFYPITALPGWLQPIAQGFPLYWLGLGTRAALSPDAAAAGEIGESWRVMETVGVLGLWAVVGLLLAPRVLRRMAQRESGSLLEQRRQAVMQWGT